MYQAWKLIFYHSFIRIFPYYYYWTCNGPVQSLVVKKKPNKTTENLRIFWIGECHNLQVLLSWVRRICFQETWAFHTHWVFSQVWKKRAGKGSTECLRNSSKQKSWVLRAGSRMCLYFTITEHQFLFYQDTPFSPCVSSIHPTLMLNFKKTGELQP